MTTLAAPREIRRAGLLGRVGGRLRVVGRDEGGFGNVAPRGGRRGGRRDGGRLPRRIADVRAGGIWGAWLGAIGIATLWGWSGHWPGRSGAADPRRAGRAAGQPELGERLRRVGGTPGGRGIGAGTGRGPLIEGARGAGGRSGAAGGRAGGGRCRRGGPVRRLALGMIVAGLVAAPPCSDPRPVLGRSPGGSCAVARTRPRAGMVTRTVTPGDAVVALGSDLEVTAGGRALTRHGPRHLDARRRLASSGTIGPRGTSHRDPDGDALPGNSPTRVFAPGPAAWRGGPLLGDDGSAGREPTLGGGRPSSRRTSRRSRPSSSPRLTRRSPRARAKRAQFAARRGRGDGRPRSPSPRADPSRGSNWRGRPSRRRRQAEDDPDVDRRDARAGPRGRRGVQALYPFDYAPAAMNMALDGPVESHRLVVRPDLPPTLSMTPGRGEVRRAPTTC